MVMIFRLEDYTKDEFPLAIRPTQHGDHPLHIHDFQEMVIVLCGTGTHITGKEKYQITGGDVFMVSKPDQSPHGYMDSNGVELINVIFDLKRLALPLQDFMTSPGFRTLFELEPQMREAHKFESRLRLNMVELSTVEGIAMKIKQELEERKPCYKPLCIGMLLELFTFLSRVVPDKLMPKQNALWTIGRALRIIEIDYMKKHTLASLADEAGMSTRNFQKLFTEAVGESPINYLISIRMQKAAEALLNDPNAKIETIAIGHGFYDGNYFARQFLKAKGVSPREYRERNQRRL